MPILIHDSAGTAVNFRANTTRFSNAVNMRGVLNFEVTTTAASLPIEIGEDVFVMAAPATTWNAIADTGSVETQDAGTTLTRLTGNGWDSGFHSDESYTSGAEITFQVTQTDQAYMIGLSADATVDQNFTSIDYAIHPTVTSMSIYESGVFIEIIDAGYSIGDICRIRYDGSSIHYYLNNVLKRSVNGIGGGLTFFADSSFNSVGGKAKNVMFGPSEVRVFGGTVDQIKETDYTTGATTTRKAAYRCTDFDQIASRRVAVKSYSNTTAGAIVSDLITTYLTAENITEGTIATGPVMERVNFPYIKVSQAMDEIAAQTGFSWTIDKNKALQFTDRTQTDAVFDLTSGNKPYMGITIVRTRNSYVNQQWLRAGLDLTDTLTEIEQGESNKRAFAVSYPVGTVTSVEVETSGGGYVAKTVGVLGVDSGLDWYYQKGSPIFSQDTGGTLLTASDTVRFKYEGQYPVVVQGIDGAEITARALVESGTGTYEGVLSDPSIDDADAAYTKAQALLERFGTLPVRVTYQTDTAGLSAGDLQTITLSDHELTGEWLLESVAGHDRGDGELRYTIVALNGQAVGGWQKFFRDLGAGTRFVIRENEVLVILAPVHDTMSLADDATGATTASSGTTVGAADAYVGLIDAG